MGEIEEALGAIYKEVRGIKPNSSSDGTFNTTVRVAQCYTVKSTGFVSNTDQMRGGVSLLLGSYIHPMPPVLFCPALFPIARHMHFLLFSICLCLLE